MKALYQQSVLIMCLLGLTAAQARSEVQVQAQVDRSRPIYAGSTFSYSIIVSGGEQSNTPDLSALREYHPSNPSSRSQTTIMNGRTSSYRILTYQLVAPSEGDHVIPSIAVQVGGKTYKTSPINISVVKPGDTQQMDIEATLSTEECYVGQPVVLTLSLYIWSDIVRAEQIANINFRVPFLNENHFYQEDIDSHPQGTKQIALPVNGQKQPVYQSQVMHNGVDCVRVQYIKVLIPKNAGTLELKAASATADIAVGRSRNRSSFFGPQYEYKRFGVEAEPLTLKTNNLPQTGKPSNFYGLVGNYTITADAAPTQVNVGDPITLKIKIGASQYLKAVQWPNLEQIPEMTNSFKIPSEYADGEMDNGAKVFTQTIRAASDTVTQIPPIPLSFFDAKAGQYRTVYSDPIPLEVSPTRIVTGTDVESRSQTSPASKQIKAVKEGISANHLSADALVNQHYSVLSVITSPVFVILWILPVVALIGSSTAGLIRAGNPQRQIANKRKKAYARAIKRIRHAEKQPTRQISAALKQYIADKFDKTAGSLTGPECNAILLDKTQDRILSEKFQVLIEQVESSEYSPMSFELTHEKQTKICELLTEIETRIK